MTHEEKMQKMYDDLPRRGILKSSYAPPHYKILWMLGIRIPPPIFSSFITLFLAQASFFAVFWGVLMYLMVWRKQDITLELMVSSACVVGMLFGLITAALIKRQAKKHNLPSWKDYGNS